MSLHKLDTDSSTESIVNAINDLRGDIKEWIDEFKEARKEGQKERMETGKQIAALETKVKSLEKFAWFFVLTSVALIAETTFFLASKI